MAHERQKQLIVYTVLLASHFVAACGDDAPEEPRLKARYDDALPNPDADGEGGSDAADGEQADGGGAGGGAPPVDIAALSESCGIDLEDTAAAWRSSTLNALPRTVSGSVSVLGFPVPYQATFAGRVAQSGTLSQSRVELVTELSSVNPEVGKPAAEPMAKALSGVADAELATRDARVFLAARSGGFTNVACAVAPAVLVTYRGGDGGELVVRFSAPIPWQVNSSVPISVLKSEIGTGLTFAEVKATVERSTVATVSQGSTFGVAARVSAAQLPQTVNGVTVGGDAAFQISYQASGAAAERLGLSGTRSYFIDDGAAPLKALVLAPATGGAQVYIRPAGALP